MKPLLACLAALAMAACVTLPPPAERQRTAQTLAAERGLQPVRLPAGAFTLAAWIPRQWQPDGELTIYIEGDGLAWVTESQPSADPTPANPLALRLALAQPGGNAAWLARPCQYMDAENTGCPPATWQERRFSPEVVAATSQAIDALKRQAGTRRLNLVGYSGGGAVAALVAARRDDVARLITVTGNLDTAAWAARHRITPLAGSLNPADEAATLAGIPQWHFVGGRDRNITPELLRGYAAHFPAARRPQVIVLPDFDHACCWAEQWPELWKSTRKRSMTE